MELARMLMSECNTTADVQSKLKRLFAGDHVKYIV